MLVVAPTLNGEDVLLTESATSQTWVSPTGLQRRSVIKGWDEELTGEARTGHETTIRGKHAFARIIIHLSDALKTTRTV